MLAWPVSRATRTSGRSIPATIDASSTVRLPGQTPGGMFSTQSTTLGSSCVVGKFVETGHQNLAARLRLGGVREAAGVDDQAGPADVRQPVDATFDVVDRAPCRRGLDRAEIDPWRADRLTSPAPVSCYGPPGPRRRPRSRSPTGPGAARQSGRTSDDGGPESSSDRQVDGEGAAAESVGRSWSPADASARVCSSLGRVPRDGSNTGFRKDCRVRNIEGR